jgi:hypothetical protein
MTHRGSSNDIAAVGKTEFWIDYLLELNEKKAMEDIRSIEDQELLGKLVVTTK